MSLSTTMPTREQTLGPLTAGQRQTIMHHAPSLTPDARRLFRRLLILTQAHGLDNHVIARAAAQAREHIAAVS